MTMPRDTAQTGFSLLEVILALAITSILLVVSGTFITDGTVKANVDYNRTLVQNNTKNAVETVAQSVRSARSVLPTNTHPDLHPPVEGNAYSWSSTAGENATLILAVPSKDASGNLIYVDGLHSSVYTDDVIYYLEPSNDRLYRRVLANGVPGNAAKTTCPPDQATADCPADRVIVEDIASLSTEFFDSLNQPVTAPSGTEAVGYAVTETKLIAGRSYSSTYRTVIAMRNR